VALALAVAASARRALTQIGAATWMVALAAVGETVLPPLSWAPPHPQYHLQLSVAVVVLLVPLLTALLRSTRGQLLAGVFFFGNLALSAFRYTRYPGY